MDDGGASTDNLDAIGAAIRHTLANEARSAMQSVDFEAVEDP